MESLVVSDKYGVPTDVLLSEDGQHLFICTFRGYLLKYQVDHLQMPLCTWRVTKKPLRKMLAIPNLKGILLSTPKGSLFWVNAETGDAKETIVVFNSGSSNSSKEKTKSSSAVDKQNENDNDNDVGDGDGDGDDGPKPTKIGAVSALAFADGILAIGNESGDLHVATINEDALLSVSFTSDFHDDFIASLVVVPEKKMILCGSGDGVMTVVDLKKQKVVAQTKNFDEDVTSLLHLPSLGKVVLATGGGNVKFIKWNYWGSSCDSIKSGLHGGNSITDMLCVEGAEGESLIFSSDDEGVIRYFLPFTDKPKEWITQKDPIEKMLFIKKSSKIVCLFADSNELAILRLDTSALSLNKPKDSGDSDADSDNGSHSSDDDDHGSDEEEESSDDENDSKKKQKNKKARKNNQPAKSDFFAGLD